MPTKAEVWFVAKLFADKKIPPLFNSGTGYWCASGKVKPSGDGVIGDNDLSGTSPVRCVYDEWYWGSEKEKTAGQETLTSFTWGDAPRN